MLIFFKKKEHIEKEEALRRNLQGHAFIRVCAMAMNKKCREEYSPRAHRENEYGYPDEKNTLSDQGTFRRKGPIPPDVESTSPSGVESQSLSLARAFMRSQGQLARKCDQRHELSHLYVSTMKTWMPQGVQDDIQQQRPFKQVLFALAHGLKVVRVLNRGRALVWIDDEYADRVSNGRYRRNYHSS